MTTRYDANPVQYKSSSWGGYLNGREVEQVLHTRLPLIAHDCALFDDPPPGETRPFGMSQSAFIDRNVSDLADSVLKRHFDDEQGVNFHDLGQRDFQGSALEFVPEAYMTPMDPMPGPMYDDMQEQERPSVDGTGEGYTGIDGPLWRAQEPMTAQEYWAVVQLRNLRKRGRELIELERAREKQKRLKVQEEVHGALEKNDEESKRDNIANTVAAVQNNVPASELNEDEINAQNQDEKAVYGAEEVDASPDQGDGEEGVGQEGDGAPPSPASVIAEGKGASPPAPASVIAEGKGASPPAPAPASADAPTPEGPEGLPTSTSTSTSTTSSIKSPEPTKRLDFTSADRSESKKKAKETTAATPKSKATKPSKKTTPKSTSKPYQTPGQRRKNKMEQLDEKDQKLAKAAYQEFDELLKVRSNINDDIKELEKGRSNPEKRAQISNLMNEKNANNKTLKELGKTLSSLGLPVPAVNYTPKKPTPVGGRTRARVKKKQQEQKKKKEEKKE